MNVIKVGEPLVTRTGTVISKYIENGRFYKMIDFEKSTNRVAKEKGLIKTVVKYGEGNKPTEFTDTFVRTTKLPVTKPAEEVPPKVAEPHTPKTTVPKDEKPAGSINPTKPKEKVNSSNTIMTDTPRLVSISTDSFSRDTAKKLYLGISKYIRLAGKNGSFKEARIMTEKGIRDNPNVPALAKEADILLSLNRTGENMHLTLARKNFDKSKNDILFDVLVNKDGQMIEGRYPLEHMTFERRGANVRRLKKHNSQYLPIAGNDREWNCNGTRISGVCGDNLWYAGREDNAISGAFEIFMEMARLHTSVLK